LSGVDTLNSIETRHVPTYTNIICKLFEYVILYNILSHMTLENNLIKWIADPWFIIRKIVKYNFQNIHYCHVCHYNIYLIILCILLLVHAFMVTRFEYNYIPMVFLCKLLKTVYPHYIFGIIVKCSSYYKLSIFFTGEYDLN